MCRGERRIETNSPAFPNCPVSSLQLLAVPHALGSDIPTALQPSII